MKKLLFLLLFPLCVSAQDTTKVLNLSLQAQLIEYLAPTIASPENDSAFNVFLKWRTLMRNSKATGTTVVVTDTIPTELVASMYNTILGEENGLIIGTLMRTALTTPRKNNKYLDRLCTDIDNKWAAVLIDRRAKGRKMLLGK